MKKDVSYVGIYLWESLNMTYDASHQNLRLVMQEFFNDEYVIKSSGSWDIHHPVVGRMGSHVQNVC